MLLELGTRRGGHAAVEPRHTLGTERAARGGLPVGLSGVRRKRVSSSTRPAWDPNPASLGFEPCVAYGDQRRCSSGELPLEAAVEL